MGTTKANGYILQNGGSTLVTTLTSNSFLPRFSHILKSLCPFLAFLLIYFANRVLRILPALEDLGCVHIYTINAIEEFLFGCHPHKIISKYHLPVLDFLSAVPYLMHYIIPVVFPIYLFIKSQAENIAKFYWLLGWVMWVHYLFWVIFPHTPPWVIDNIQLGIHKFNATSITQINMKHREGCAFARLDKLTGGSFFYNMFSGNPIPYASFPSGHVAWATVAYMTAPPGSNFLAVYIGWVIWATLYSCHHYVSDAIGALFIVTVTQKALQFFENKNVCSSNYKCRALNSFTLPI